jgi:hypothetical protein
MASASRTPSARTTTPRAGNVSRPENGGARKAVSARMSTSAPNTVRLARPRVSEASRGRENRSSHRILLTRVLVRRSPPRLCRSIRLQRLGSQIERRPAMSCRATSIATASKTWVTPPVGRGRAGTAIRTMKTSAKLFSPKRSIRSPRVRGDSSRSHCSSRSLTLGTSVGWSKYFSVAIVRLSAHDRRCRRA